MGGGTTTGGTGTDDDAVVVAVDDAEDDADDEDSGARFAMSAGPTTVVATELEMVVESVLESVSSAKACEISSAKNECVVLSDVEVEAVVVVVVDVAVVVVETSSGSIVSDVVVATDVVAVEIFVGDTNGVVDASVDVGVEVEVDVDMFSSVLVVSAVPLALVLVEEDTIVDRGPVSDGVEDTSPTSHTSVRPTFVIAPEVAKLGGTNPPQKISVPEA